MAAPSYNRPSPHGWTLHILAVLFSHISVVQSNIVNTDMFYNVSVHGTIQLA